MTMDVMVIGGSFAGQAAALQLARTRRNILLVDAKSPRNRFARSSFGFLGQDGEEPAAIIAKAATQLRAYPTVETVDDMAVSAFRVHQGFRVAFASGREVTSRLLILAVGSRDMLPGLAGLTERWGVSVLHCPYCHGYELGQRPIGVLASSPAAFHQAMLGADWGPTTLFTEGLLELTANQMDALARRGVSIETTPIVELLGQSPTLDAVRLADGRIIAMTGLFVAPKTEVLPELAEQLGCAFKQDFLGMSIAVDDRNETSVRGVFAAGNAANPMANATLSAASGVIAASSAHQTLIFGGA